MRSFIFVLLLCGIAAAQSPDSIKAYNKPVNIEKVEFTGVLSINSAPADSLVLLPGIGEKLAERIIEYRSVKPFKSVYEIIRVSGIGEKKFVKLYPYIRL